MYNPYKKQDFYWERIFIMSLIGAGGGASIAYLLEVDWFVYVGLGIAIGIAFATMMQTDQVSGIKSKKIEPPLTIEKITKDSFEEEIPDDIKGLMK